MEMEKVEKQLIDLVLENGVVDIIMNYKKEMENSIYIKIEEIKIDDGKYNKEIMNIIKLSLSNNRLRKMEDINSVIINKRCRDVMFNNGYNHIKFWYSIKVIFNSNDWFILNTNILYINKIHLYIGHNLSYPEGFPSETLCIL